SFYRDELVGKSQERTVFGMDEMKDFLSNKVQLLVELNLDDAVEGFPVQLSKVERLVNAVVEEKKLRKRIIYVLIESLQNVSRHGLRTGVGVQPKMMFGETDTRFFLLVSNPINNNEITRISRRLDTLKKLSKAEIKGLIREKMEQCEFTTKGGAG